MTLSIQTTATFTRHGVERRALTWITSVDVLEFYALARAMDDDPVAVEAGKRQFVSDLRAR